MNTESNFWCDRAGQHRLSARARDPHALLERVIEADKIIWSAIGDGMAPWSAGQPPWDSVLGSSKN